MSQLSLLTFYFIPRFSCPFHLSSSSSCLCYSLGQFDTENASDAVDSLSIFSPHFTLLLLPFVYRVFYIIIQVYTGSFPKSCISFSKIFTWPSYRLSCLLLRITLLNFKFLALCLANPPSSIIFALHFTT